MIAFVWTLLASKWLSWIGVAVKAVWWGITSFFRGLSFLQNPFEMFTVGVLALVAFCAGGLAGIRYDAHLVKEAKRELATVYDNMSKKDREDARKAAEARVARAAAEAAERQRQINEANTAKLPPLAVVAPPLPAGTAVSSHPPVVAGVRQPDGPRKPKTDQVRRRKSEPSLLDSIQAAFSGSDGAGAR
jgi:Sec-independent protein translocase protein TatA